MKSKMSMLVWIVGVCLLGTLVGCDKPTTGGKKTAPAPGPAPANTTEAK